MPGVDVTPIAVIGRLHRLATALTREITEVYARYGLSEGEFDVLAALRRAGPPHLRAAGQLAEHTMVTTGAISKRVDRLQTAGLVRRQPRPTDGRGCDIRLTAKGLRIIDTAFAEHIANEHRLIAPLDKTERATLQRLLTTWLADLDCDG